MEFKIIGVAVWVLMCIIGFNASLNQLNLPSDTGVAIGIGGILFIFVANVFLARYVISNKKGKEKVNN